jgi:hypothetical protein
LSLAPDSRGTRSAEREPTGKERNSASDWHVWYFLATVKKTQGWGREKDASLGILLRLGFRHPRKRERESGSGKILPIAVIGREGKSG